MGSGKKEDLRANLTVGLRMGGVARSKEAFGDDGALQDVFALPGMNVPAFDACVCDACACARLRRSFDL